MEGETNQPPSKPTAYLDQNIFDLFVKGKGLAFLENLKSNFLIVYSDETLNEIHRSGEHSQKFISVLDKAGAYHLKLVMEQPGFIETDRATLTLRDPQEAFIEYCENVKGRDKSQTAMERMMFKYCGGLKGVSISDIHDEQKIEFAELMRGLGSDLQEISYEIPEIGVLFEQYQKEMTSQLENALDETERLIGKNISNDTDWSGVKEFRHVTGLGPKELNNIEPPGILRKIWETYRYVPPYNEMDIDLETFFGLKLNPIFPDRPYYKHQKVLGIYNMLNSLGYWPDSKVHKERRFVAAMSDNSHASMASFCSVLFSRDEAFTKKVRAAYEYLEISTLVQYLEVKV